jgi:hypothetical protein
MRFVGGSETSGGRRWRGGGATVAPPRPRAMRGQWAGAEGVEEDDTGSS